MRVSSYITIALGCISFAAHAAELPAVHGQYIRIELPGENRALSLAEVRVFNKGINLALNKPAIQSSTAYSGGGGLAVDGSADGDYMKGSVTHTAHTANPWWEVDLAKVMAIEEIVVYNRTDSHGQRLDGFTLKILDAERNVVFQKAKIPQSASVSFLQAGVKSSRPVEAVPVAKSAGPAHLFILSGQSNMVGLNPDVSFTPTVTDAFGPNNVIVVKDAHNSQSISRWVKDWTSVQGMQRANNGDLYDRLIGNVKASSAGRKLESVTLVWMQGEADAACNQVGVYKESLDALLDRLRQDLDRNNIRFVLGRLSDYSLDTGRHPEWQAMRDLQVTYADASPLRAWVDTDDLNNKTDKAGNPRNDVHYTREGYEIFGRRLAEKAIELINAKAFPGDKTDFRGYDRYDRIKSASGHFSIVCPRNPPI